MRAEVTRSAFPASMTPYSPCRENPSPQSCKVILRTYVTLTCEPARDVAMRPSDDRLHSTGTSASAFHPLGRRGCVATRRGRDGTILPVKCIGDRITHRELS